MWEAGRCFSLSVPARDLGEAGFRVCGYMGLDSMGSSLMETQKLSFEEQPDAKVSLWLPGAVGILLVQGLGCHQHHPTLWDVTPSPSSACHSSLLLAITPHSRSASLLWHVQQSRQPKDPHLSLETSLRLTALWLPKSAQFPQPWFLLLMRSTAACHKMKVWSFVCR